MCFLRLHLKSASLNIHFFILRNNTQFKLSTPSLFSNGIWKRKGNSEMLCFVSRIYKMEKCYGK